MKKENMKFQMNRILKKSNRMMQINFLHKPKLMIKNNQLQKLLKIQKSQEVEELRKRNNDTCIYMYLMSVY